MDISHISVLSQEVKTIFSNSCLKHYLDGTLGAGGHAWEILSTHQEIEKFIGIDQDPLAIQMAKNRLRQWGEKSHFFLGNFAHLDTFCNQASLNSLDGILLDLGVSSMQFDLPEKGFSFMHEGLLDMRMDPKNFLTAEIIVNTWSFEDLAKIFREYGEEKFYKKAAFAIVKKRARDPIRTTKELAHLLENTLPKEKKNRHPATLVFQALRICVNRELDVLEEVLPKALSLLAKKARLAVISFHSLEDRIVKNAFRFAASDKMDTSGICGVFLDKEPIVKLITKKPIIPSKEEIEKNPRSRSAKLRVVEKLS